ncbi:MAG: hypothetical protein GX219_08855 [Tissierellia bacterium]|nr:hypothetical protein [Tissierellia bacterium]
MNYRDLDEKFINMLKDNPSKYLKDYLLAEEKVSRSTAIYKGEPVPFLLHPMMWTREDVDAFEKISKRITGITDKITDRYFKDSDYRKVFGYSEDAERLILRKKGYERNVPIGRFDIFYESPENFYFCEINTDGSSAMNEDNTIGRILTESEAFKDFSKDFKLTGFELIESWVDKLLYFYKEWGGKGKPNVAILDFKTSATSSEFQVFKESIEARGFNCEIVDPVDTEYRDGGLYYGNYKIDLVYRRLVTFELLERIDEIGEFINAYMDNVFCSVGEVRSQIMHNKESFRVIRKEETMSFLDEEERDFVLNHFPETERLTRDEGLIKKLIGEKDNYVLKPSDKNASQGVFIGKDTKKEDWERAVREGEEYIYQGFITPVRRNHGVLENGRLEVASLGYIVGLFIYDGAFQGIYTRVSHNDLISGITDYYTLPNFLVEEKR